MEQYLTKPQLAERLQKSVKTIERWCKEGVLPFRRIGNGRGASVLFDWAEVQQQLKAKFGVNTQ